MAESKAYNMDCMDAMKEFPDKFFDLAVVDPPYGGVEQTHIFTVLLTEDSEIKAVCLKNTDK